MAFIICGTAILAIFFFLLGVACKGLASAVNSAVETIILGTAVAVLGVLLIGALWLIYMIGFGLITARMWEILELLILLAVLGVVIFLFVGWIGLIALEIAVYFVIAVVKITSDFLENAAFVCEKAYAYFLDILVKQLEKC